ncbi:MAG TPA: recombinase RecT [Alphaproteobacteria bacterium]|jgi:hypothetical protein
MAEEVKAPQPQGSALPERMEIARPSEDYNREAEGRALSYLNPKIWNHMAIVAKTFLDSGAMPQGIKNAQQMMMVLQAGLEAGMGPVESLSAFYIVNGKLSIYGDRAISQVVKAKHKVEWGKCDDASATVKITRADNGTSMEETYTLDQAKKAGLLEKGGPWVKFPGRMLKHRVFANVAHYIVPDALGGLMIEGEAETIDRKPVENTSTTPEATSLAAALEGGQEAAGEAAAPAAAPEATPAPEQPAKKKKAVPEGAPEAEPKA